MVMGAEQLSLQCVQTVRALSVIGLDPQPDDAKEGRAKLIKQLLVEGVADKQWSEDKVVEVTRLLKDYAGL